MSSSQTYPLIRYHFQAIKSDETVPLSQDDCVLTDVNGTGQTEKFLHVNGYDHIQFQQPKGS
jgi:hypothetical protein